MSRKIPKSQLIKVVDALPKELLTSMLQLSGISLDASMSTMAMAIQHAVANYPLNAMNLTEKGLQDYLTDLKLKLLSDMKQLPPPTILVREPKVCLSYMDETYLISVSIFYLDFAALPKATA